MTSDEEFSDASMSYGHWDCCNHPQLGRSTVWTLPLVPKKGLTLQHLGFGLLPFLLFSAANFVVICYSCPRTFA